MKTKFISSKEIKQELKQMEEISALLSLKLSLLTQNITHIFSEIKSCEDINTINEYFGILDKIQSTLALLAHQENIGLSDRLWRFMNDFDNFDGVKDYYLIKIKAGEYFF